MSYNEGGDWSKPVNLGPEVNTEGDEIYPHVDLDNYLYFSSDGLLGLGGLDVFECRPAQYGFKSPRNIQAPINTNKDDFGFTLNKSKTAGYLSSNRKIGQQTDDLFYFSRQEVLPLLLSGKLSNELVNEANLAESKIRIIDNEGSIIKTKHLNDDGTFYFEIDPTHTDFKIQTNDGTGWINHSMNDRLTSITEEEKYLGELDFGNVLIESNPFYFDEILLDDDSSILLKGYEVNLTNTTTGEKTKVPVGSDGSIAFELDPNSKYEIEYSKKGWLSELRTFNSEDLVKSKDSFKKKLAFSPEKIEIGKTIAIKNINYDFNKSEIRRDAQIILDQLVNFMNKNPTVEIEISSHTDARGSAAYNMRLSQKRAKSALNYLTKMGISKKRLKCKGYGKSMLKNKCKKKNDCNDEFHEVNRRTEFIITAFQ